MTQSIKTPPRTTLQECNVVFADSWKDVGRKSLATHWIVFSSSHSPQERWLATFANLSGRRDILKDLEHTAIGVVAEALEQGLPSSAVDRVISLMGLNQTSMSDLLDISTSTLKRRSVLKSTSSERLFRISSLFQKALEVFEDRAEARRWFMNPKRALGGKTPLEYSETEVGAREVEDLLGRLEYGVYT